MSGPIGETLRGQPVLLIFILIGLGYLIGKIRIGSFSFGPVAGVLFAGLFFGHFGYRLSGDVQSLGFALFIFSVGYQAGPRFFDVLRTDGLKYFLLALVIAVTAFGLSALATRLIEFEPGTSAGLLSGALTSSPTLAAAQEAVRGGLIAPPEGYTADAMIGNIATAYAITYIFGLAGLIAIIKVLPALLKLDLVSMAAELESRSDGGESNEATHICARTYRVTNEALTQVPVGEVLNRFWDGVSIGQLCREGKVLPPDPDRTLQLGDEVVLVGPVEFFLGGITGIGEEIATTSDLAKVEDARIVVINKDAVGKTLGELHIMRDYRVLLLHFNRSGHEVPRGDDVVLRKSDVLTVTGPRQYVDRLGEALGHVERDVPETDMVTFAFGIAIGVAVGLLSIKVGGVSIGLGSAGGMVASGIVIGFLRSIHPTFGRMPAAVRWIFMEFGLLLFMAGVGLRAGGDIIETFLEAGPKLIIAGICVTLVPVLVGYLFGRKALKLNPVLLLGGITGSMTSGASLSIVTNAARSTAPALGYTGAYAFANILLTIAGTLILLL